MLMLLLAGPAVQAHLVFRHRSPRSAADPPLAGLHPQYAWGQQWGVGALGSLHVPPDRLDSAYDDTPLSFMIFARATL